MHVLCYYLVLCLSQASDAVCPQTSQAWTGLHGTEMPLGHTDMLLPLYIAYIIPMLANLKYSALDTKLGYACMSTYKRNVLRG